MHLGSATQDSATVDSSTAVPKNGKVKITDRFKLLKRKKVDKVKRPYPVFLREDWGWSLAFLLSMIMVGLQVYPMLFVALFIMANRMMNDRHEFIIQLTFFFGGYALTDTATMHFKVDDIAFVLAIVCYFIFRKPPVVLRTFYLYVVFAIGLLVLASFSEESFAVQLYTYRFYLYFIYFMIPVAVFAGHEFRIEEFFRKLLLYALILCVFYAVDSFILSGNFFIPRSFTFSGIESTLWAPYIKPLSFIFFRKNPPGLYILLLCVYPITRVYRLRPVQWIIVAAGLIATKTFAVITGLILLYIILQGSFIRMCKYLGIAIGLFVLTYVVDGMLPVNNINRESTFRVKSSIDQIIELSRSVDIESISKFGSGRAAQIIPKFELLYQQNKQWTGLGFLHPDRTKNTKYMIHNDLYENVALSDELATGVENAQAQTILTIGYIGFIFQLLFYISLWYIIRRRRYATYYITTLFGIYWFGISGLCHIQSFQGLAILALSYSAAILAEPDYDNTIRRKRRKQRASAMRQLSTRYSKIPDN